MWAKSGLPGLLSLVERSWKPLQEASWASIGNHLTAIQTRLALYRDILIPGTKTQHEAFKTVQTLHDADRGGFIFEPVVGMHENIHELDFASLYPNIMIEHNVSPETVLCDCHADRETVPVLGYNICDEPGFVPDVLDPIVADRAGETSTIRDASPVRDALKWVLVTCFGYQGYKNAKFGRIEAHEAINAFARDILLTTKKLLESNGWHIAHGIVDSIWVEPAPNEAQTPLKTVTDEITETVNIPLEYEREFDWLCFVPQRESTRGALTKYFGKIRGEDDYKIRGIEIRQRSTPPFIEAAQRSFIETLDRQRQTPPVIDRCQRLCQKIETKTVAPADLVIKKRISKPLEAYTQTTHTVAALHRYRDAGIDKQPGETVRYVVVDDTAKRTPDRVRLSFEPTDSYDVEYYTTELIRACESIVSPLGWDRHDIRRTLRRERDLELKAFEP